MIGGCTANSPSLFASPEEARVEEVKKVVAKEANEPP